MLLAIMLVSAAQNNFTRQKKKSQMGIVEVNSPLGKTMLKTVIVTQNYSGADIWVSKRTSI